MFLSYSTRKAILERIRRLFGGMPCRVQVAALPWRKGQNGVEVMLITSRGTGRWVLPKGWPENIEQLGDAAMREAREEAGLVGGTIHSEFGRYFYNKALSSGHEWQCEVRVYPIEVDEMADSWPEMKKRRRQWFRPQDAARLVAEPDLGELITGFGQSRERLAA
ncbi:MAG: NUDIX hydrolase [Mesorhizobium sp.]